MKLAIVLGFLLCAIPARADSIEVIGSAGFKNVFLTANGQINVSAIEGFSTSFVYDTLSQQVSDMVFSASGLLGKHFTFAGVSVSQGNLTFDWINRSAIIDLFIPSQDIPTADHPLSGEIEGTTPFQLQCRNDRCEDDTVHRSTSGSVAEAMFLGPSPASVVPTPEPPTLAMFGIGLIASLFMLRRKFSL